jgi:predicted protein tyrosine phosphatase
MAESMRVLFLCSRNQLRSPTAAHLFASWPGVETDSAGLADDAVVPLSSEQLEWAELVCVMEPAHRRKLSREHARWLKNKRVVCLDVPDEFTYMQPELVALLKRRVGPLLRAA